MAVQDRSRGCPRSPLAVFHTLSAGRFITAALFALSFHVLTLSQGVPGLQTSSLEAPPVPYLSTAEAGDGKTKEKGTVADTNSGRPSSRLTQTKKRDEKRKGRQFSGQHEVDFELSGKQRHVEQSQPDTGPDSFGAHAPADGVDAGPTQGSLSQTHRGQEKTQRVDGFRPPSNMAAAPETPRDCAEEKLIPPAHLPGSTAVVASASRELRPNGKLRRAKWKALDKSRDTVDKLATDNGGIRLLASVIPAGPDQAEGEERRPAEASERRALQKELFRRFEEAEQKAIGRIRPLDVLFEERRGARYEYLMHLRPGRPGLLRGVHLLVFLVVLASSRPESWNYLYLLVGWGWVAAAFLTLCLYSLKRDRLLTSIARELKSGRWWGKSLEEKKAAQSLLLKVILEREKPRIAGSSAIGAGLSFLLLSLFVGRKPAVGPVVPQTPHALLSLDSYFPQIVTAVLLLYGAIRLLSSLAARRRYAKILGSKGETTKKARGGRREQRKQGQERRANAHAVLQPYVEKVRAT
ncbi:transmembrane protein [Cystoisospora suis]|uniref:Transmembrane protein n=1 Tax=Cystoisospora suis TaxID=483139 RepID=A0A2C6LH47_9APIC|nr:transmembrane protein [Cystoisospora suis]